MLVPCCYFQFCEGYRWWVVCDWRHHCQQSLTIGTMLFLSSMGAPSLGRSTLYCVRQCLPTALPVNSLLALPAWPAPVSHPPSSLRLLQPHWTAQFLKQDMLFPGSGSSHGPSAYSHVSLAWAEFCLPRKICWSPNWQYLRIWPSLEIEVTELKWGRRVDSNPIWLASL